MDRRKENGSSGLTVWVLVTAALAAASVHVMVLALALPLALTYTMMRFGTAGTISGIAALGAAALFSPAYAAAFALAFIPVSVAAAISIRRKKRFQNSVIAASGAALAGVALAVGLLWLVRGITPADYALQRVGGIFAQLDDASVSFVYQWIRYPDIATGAITQQAVLFTPRAQAISVMLDMLREAVNTSIVPVMLIYSLLWGLLCYLIPHHAARRRGLPVIAVPAFSDYALPRRLWAAFLISYIAALAGDSLNLTPSGMLEPTIGAVYAFVFTVQALSFMDFFYKERGMRTGMRVALHTAAALLLGFMLMWVGIFENIIRFRDRMQEKGGAEL